MDRRGVVTVKVVGVAIAAREKSITIASPDRFFVMKMIPSSTSTPTPLGGVNMGLIDWSLPW